MPNRDTFFAEPRLEDMFRDELNAGVFHEIMQNIRPRRDGLIDEEYQAKREANLKAINYVEYITKCKLEAQKKEAFREQYCTRCIRREICEKIGSVYDCALFQEDTTDFLNTPRLRMRGV